MHPEVAPCASTTRATPYSRYNQPVTRTCPECSAPFDAMHRKRTFCCPAHKLAFHNRCAARGKVLIPLAMAWCTKRGSGDTAKRAFRELCRALDAFAAEDRKAGRAPMSDYVELGYRLGHRD